MNRTYKLKLSQPASQPVAKPERIAGWNQSTMKSNNSKPEHSEIKQSETKNTVKSNNPKPEHNEIKQSEIRTQWNQTIPTQNTQKSPQKSRENHVCEMMQDTVGDV